MSSHFDLFARRVFQKIFKPKKTWAGSQDYELYHAIVSMRSSTFGEYAQSFKNGDQKISTGYKSESVLKEFFDSDQARWNDFIRHITGKKCLEIGPCIASAIGAWDLASERHVVEPLFDSIDSWQRKNFGFSLFEEVIAHAVGAELIIPELIGEIDGAIYCRNCIDHSPQWAFILANIAHYAKPGCRLLLWNDLDHKGTADEGHYDITTDLPAFKRLIEALGFEVKSEYIDQARTEINWGCLAIKR